MSKDQASDAASAARAARLREQIDQIGSGSAENRLPTDKEESPNPPSARDFVQQRMRELDRKK